MSNETKSKTDYSIGSIHESNNYGPFKIIELDHVGKYYNKYFKVRFLETGYTTVASTSHIRSGNVKDHTYDFDYSIGSIHESNNYGPFKIIELDHIDGHRTKHFKIQFLKTGYETVAIADCIRSGEVADPFAKTVCGIGYLGMEKIPDGAKRDHGRWGHMIHRCNNPNDPSYSFYGALGVTVCERWYCFKNYYEDMPYIPGRQNYLSDPDNYQLDKDVLQQGIPKSQQVYSPETCMFIPVNINAAHTSRSGTNSISGYYGVSEYHSTGNYITKINYNNTLTIIGVYPTIEVAAGAYNQFVLSHGLSRVLNPVPPISEAQARDFDLRYGNKIEMCRIVGPSKLK